MGGEAAPHLPNAGTWKLTRRFESLPPRPHPRKPVRETDSLRDPDINAVRRAGRPLAGPRPPRLFTPRAPGAALARAGGPAPASRGRALGTSGKARRTVPGVTTSRSKVAAPSLVEQTALVRWL